REDDADDRPGNGTGGRADPDVRGGVAVLDVDLSVLVVTHQGHRLDADDLVVCELFQVVPVLFGSRCVVVGSDVQVLGQIGVGHRNSSFIRVPRRVGSDRGDVDASLP